VRELVERAQHGDHEAFETLMGGAFDRLYAVARRILRDTGRAEDAVQETLVTAWRELRGLRDPDRFEAWLARLLVNECLDQLRHARRQLPAVVLPLDHPGVGDDPERLALRDQLERGFVRLPPEQRVVVVLRYYLGLPTVEIAATLGVPEGTVSSRLHYALAGLRAALDADERPAAAERVS
jgi:RNA polymerase sigma-70 factor (ECF subfamily)